VGKHVNVNKVSIAGILIALGIIYGDIGTSPLYVLKAIVKDKEVTEDLILGGLSLIIWTLTLMTTVKYVLFTLKADNKGEGGIFSLYTLVKRQKKWLVIAAMIGGAALLADGMITPPISVSSAIEGLKQIPHLFAEIPDNATAEVKKLALEKQTQTIMIIVMAIISLLFFLQQFGTSSIGKFFGPIMTLWFVMLAILGLASCLMHDFSILGAFNPYYGFKVLTTTDANSLRSGFWILGAVFLCTTGAEALYSDLGHCGRPNIRYSWIFVKICLIINYLGQGAWLLRAMKGKVITAKMIDEDLWNPFFEMMPEWFKIIGIVIATMAAIIASQALISGSFTLISEAMRLNLWPKMKINYPTEAKGQLFIPTMNTILWIGCMGMVLYFKNSSAMEAAYGLAITLCMLSTTILFSNYLISKRVNAVYIYLFLFTYIIIETAFLIANLEKFPHGGYVALIVGGVLFLVMYVWYRARKIKNRYVEFVKLENYITPIQELSADKTIPKYATHLIYLTSANNPKEIEHKVIYSILNRKPKRAEIYWFVHVHVLDDPYTCEYEVTHIIPNDIVRVEFRVGFRVEQKIDLMFRKVVEELVANNEVNVTSRYESLEKKGVLGDFQFVVMEKFLSQDNELPFLEQLVMKAYFYIKKISLSEERGFGLDSNNVVVEKFPLIVSPYKKMKLKRIYGSE
jgi:KUP system potassium uptake protein